jgi:hypothetical protein
MRFQYFEIRPCVDDGKQTVSFLGKPVFCPSRGVEIYTPENALAEAMAYLDQHGGEFFWTLYGRDEDGLAVAIGDFPHFSDAEAAMNAILALTAAVRDKIRDAAEVEAKDQEIAALREALEQIEQQLDYGQINMALHIARRALDGGEA